MDEDTCYLLRTTLELIDFQVITDNTAADGVSLAQTQYFDSYMLDSSVPMDLYPLRDPSLHSGQLIY